VAIIAKHGKTLLVFVHLIFGNKQKKKKKKMLTGLFSSYPVSGKESSYRIINEYTPSSHNFVHKDMWIDGDKLPELKYINLL
jgi:hypothetical protein